jgi:FtsZ-interacting cell division protein YlmF
VNYLKKTSKQSKTNNKQKQQQKRIISQDKCSKLKRIQPLTKSGFSDITEICNYFIS